MDSTNSFKWKMFVDGKIFKAILAQQNKYTLLQIPKKSK